MLILDEPANGLDPHAIRWLRDFLRAQAAEGRAVLVPSHLLGEMEQLADHVVVLARRRVLASEPMAQVLKRAAGRPACGDAGGTGPAGPRPAGGRPRRAPGALRGLGATVTGLDRVRIGTLAMQAGVPLYWLHEANPSLEDFYLGIAQEEFKIS